ncbi:diacylglycerol/lipid kinase family protein [Virgibacillus byunsanensis]|uniref:Diacylglycerol/lipid kinase family protein n=1 Tax=Virgibacillus byunsanensis TaxID=570945 RepID=A0ABW3LLP7_9BACI
MYIFIINPTAGYGRARRIFSKIKKSVLFSTINSTYFYTSYEGQAEEIAIDIIKSSYHHINCVIVIGGDGTLHEVINGLCNRLPVSFIPGGSGNDFARGCSIKGSPMYIFRQIITEQLQIPYWCGTYQMDNDKDRLFVNSMGFGFDAEIARHANESNYKKVLNRLGLGKISYVIALIYVLMHFKPFSLGMEREGEKCIIHDCWMVTLTNHPFYGGGMKIIPDATIQPNEFPVLIIRGISKWKVLGFFLTVFVGKHINFKEVELFTTSTLTIHSNDTLWYQVDGQTNTCRTSQISKTSDPILVNGKFNVQTP